MNVFLSQKAITWNEETIYALLRKKVVTAN